MRILIDECLPKQLKGWLAGKHDAVTVQVQPGQKVVMDLGPDAGVWQSLRLHAIEQQEQHTTHVFKPPDMGR